MDVKDLYKCLHCEKVFEGPVYEDKDGLKYKVSELREHKCDDGVFGFGAKVGYKITQENKHG